MLGAELLLEDFKGKGLGPLGERLGSPFMPRPRLVLLQLFELPLMCKGGRTGCRGGI